MILDENAPSSTNLWFNDNVAGSYAPSSVRPGKPFGNVVSVEGSHQSVRYSLRQQHWELAKQYLAFSTKIDAVRLAAFLYRDYAFETKSPTAHTLVSVFREEFGYVNMDPQDSFDKEFETLFADDSKVVDHRDWFEEA